MRFKQALICETRVDPFDWSGLLGDLERIGLMLISPYHGTVCLIASDGDQILADPTSVAESVRQRQEVTCQLWFDEGVDVGFRLCFHDASHILEFWLDGLDATERQSASKMICRRIRDLSHDGRLIGGAIDFDGVTEEFDWEDFFLGRTRFTGPNPDYLIVSEAISAALDTCTPDMIEQRMYGYIVRSRRGSEYVCTRQ